MGFFGQYLALFQKRHKIGPYYNRRRIEKDESYAIYHSAPFSMTLNDSREKLFI